MRLSSMAYLTAQGLRGIRTNKIMSIASFCVLTVSMLLVGFSVLFTENINLFVDSVEDKNEVVVFLEDNLSGDEINALGQHLKAIDNIAEVRFYSKDEAFQDMKAGIQNADELFNYIGDESPLPDSYRIRIADISQMSTTLMSINKLHGIDSVKAPTDFVTVLTDLRSMIYIFSVVIITALVVVSLVIISNATRASVDFRKREIAIMKYVGATDTFIKIPFFIEGLLMGFFAGIFALLLTWIGYSQLVKVLMAKSTMWTAMGIKGFIPFAELAVKVAVCYLISGALMGSIGTVISTNKYVKV